MLAMDAGCLVRVPSVCTACVRCSQVLVLAMGFVMLPCAGLGSTTACYYVCLSARGSTQG